MANAVVGGLLGIPRLRKNDGGVHGVAQNKYLKRYPYRG